MLQYLGHLMQRADSLEKTLMLEKFESRRREGDDRGWDAWMASPTLWIWVWASSKLVMDRETCRAVVHGVPKSCTRLNDWIELNESRLATRKKNFNNAFPLISSSCKLVGKKKLWKNCHKCIILWNASTTKTEVRNPKRRKILLPFSWRLVSLGNSLWGKDKHAGIILGSSFRINTFWIKVRKWD